MSEIKMVVTDLDGTLLQTDHTISPEDTETLIELGCLDVCRVAATGRNLFKVRQVLTPETPFDYVIFSSGAGIMNWRKQQLIRAMAIPFEQSSALIAFLIDENQNFKVSRELPDNHNFGWWQSYDCPELKRYVDIHSKMGMAEPVIPGALFVSSQLLLFFPKAGEQFELLKQKIQEKFPDLSIIKTTSPLSDDYIWMEIFPKGVSKAHGIETICQLAGISRESTFSIGNDFNDLEMLEYTQHSYVVENAPEELKIKYLNSLAHHENGFSHAVNQHIRPKN